MATSAQSYESAGLGQSQLSTLVITPAVVSGEKLQGHSPSTSTATASSKERSETTASDITVTSAVEKISSGSVSMAMGPRPVYPVSQQRLRELRRGPTINVFVGKRPNLDLVFPVAKGLLAYFSPTLRPSLQSAGAKDIVVLQKTDKKAVSWLLRWMLNGGREKTYADTPILEDPIMRLLNRLQVVILLGVQGWLEHSLTAELQATIMRGAVTIKHLAWIYTASAPGQVRALGRHLAFTVVNAILDGRMTTCIAGASTSPTFVADVAAAVRTRKGRLYEMQNINWVPLTPFQIQFVYTFTAKDSDIRKMIAGHLHKLIDHGYVSDVDSYKQLAWKIDDFEADMSQAIEDKEKWIAEQRKAKAGGQSMRRPSKRSSIHKTAASWPPKTTEALPQHSGAKTAVVKPGHANSQPAKAKDGAAPNTTPDLQHVVKGKIDNGKIRTIKYPYENLRFVPKNPTPPPPEEPRPAALTAKASISPPNPTPGTRLESDIVLTISSDGMITKEH